MKMNMLDKKDFIDEFIDRIYLNGTKDNGKYHLTLHEAEKAAQEFYEIVLKSLKENTKK